MKNGFTLVELILTIIAIAIGALIFPIFFSPSIGEKAKEVKCRANLDQMGKLMKIYVLDLGQNVHYPKAQGEEFLVTLYHTGLLAEPIIFLCPSTRDENDDGADLANVAGAGDGDGPCSYAGRKNTDQKNYPGIFRFKKANLTPIGADDWNDSKTENHYDGEYMNFLFLDGHCDYIKSPNANFAKNYATLFDPLTN